MSFADDRLSEVAIDADQRLRDHRIQVLRADGLYRHYRCRNSGSCIDGFDIVTWPGSLCYTGDMGDFLFQRTDDMVAFMGRACRSPSYAAEKCVASGHERVLGGVYEFRREVLVELLDEAREEQRGSRHPERDLDAELDEILEAYDECQSPDDAYRAIHESRLWDGSDFPSCETFTFRFLWCLRAIGWFTNNLKSRTEAS